MNSLPKPALTMVTCYDASFARIICDTESFDYVLVGDSAANVIYGEARTTGIDLVRMLHHVEAVRRGIDKSTVTKKPCLIADLPAGSYELPERAVQTARLMLERGAEMVKIEGALTEVVHALRSKDVRVCGHIGYTPQSISEAKVQGRGEDQARRLIAEASALQKAGCELLVLELMPAVLAETITSSLRIPTIGIGAGVGCSGQVLVLYDLLGLDPDFKPKFLKKYADGYGFVRSALESYAKEVRSREYPGKDHSFSS